MTYADCTRTVRLYVPAAPLFLVREWVNVAWKQLCAARRWSFLQGELTISVRAARDVVVNVTQGALTVTSAALFVAGDAGRQLSVGTFPVYTIQTVDTTSQVTLDRAYTGETAALTTATIADRYAVMPADFASFRVVVDPSAQRRLAYWLTDEALGAFDPARSAGDSAAQGLVARAPSTYTPTLGRVQYEFYPRPSAARAYQASYNRQAERLNDTSIFHGVLQDGGEVLIAGALAQAAQWPGTGEKANPYFNGPLATSKKAEFLHGVQMLSLRDDEQSPDDHWNTWPLWGSWTPGPDTVLRASDATLADFY